jgi:1-acyl-sn-glycerol-3-phosphate acyltransferase
LLLAGLLVTLLLCPFCGEVIRLRLKASWAAALIDALGVEIEADLSHVVPGALLVANHISWIDIYVINAVLPSAFVSKAEVRDWPLIGWLVARHGTIFLRRGSRGHARIIHAEIAAVLARGQHVAVFPEGTTSDGRSLLHFHAALLQPALAAGRPVLPVALSYWEPDGQRSLAPRYDGTITLGQCMRAIVGRRRIIARLATMPACGGEGESRRQVAAEARAAIALAAGLPLANNPPGTAGDLPDELPSDAHPTGSRNPTPADAG